MVSSAVIRPYLRSGKDCDSGIQNIKVSSRTQIDADKIGQNRELVAADAEGVELHADPVDFRSTGSTAALFSPVFPNRKAVTLDQQSATAVAIAVLAPFSGDISLVDITQTGGKADLPGAA